ncbi:DUF6334 family protein [Terriglobus sp. TAA 43]|uniref:DUF6334 family protein n=1 Tax=Terriglobus sp. TAA 43 TaxID=278961 RepID=UPI000647D15D|nr:DUF6334 family protein [Terriglobus sp. TAA 43]
MSENLQPFLQAQGRQLTAVLSNDTGEGEEILLAFGADALIFRCNEDSDAIAVTFETIPKLEDADDLTTDPAWSCFIGKELSTGWLMQNQQGYGDGALLSFDGVVPEVGLNVVAAAFEVLEIRQRS